VKSDTQSWFGRVGHERAVDQIGGTIKSGLRLGGDLPRTAPYRTSQSHIPHHPLDGAPGHVVALATQLPPDLARPIDLEVGVVDPLNLDAQLVIALRACRALRRVLLPGADPKVR
jgi:hypothetical protein